MAFQGQVAARMGIISVLYLQNALASLSSSIKSDNTNPDILQSYFCHFYEIARSVWKNWNF
jgi:hypothetical protein